MTKHTYAFRSSHNTPRGTVHRLRRDDGKLVTVSKKRLAQLSAEGRLTLRTEPRTASYPQV
jgi:hypothetical protein